MPANIRRRLPRRGTSTLTAIAVMSLLLGVAAPAGATVVERDRVAFEFADTYEDCGFEVAVEGAVSLKLRIRAGTGDNEGAFFLRRNVAYHETHTNVVTGESLTIEGRFVFNEVRATRVDGDVFEFTAIDAGQPFVVTAADGEVLLRDRGLVQSTVLFDTGGDDEPGGELLDIGFELRGPHPGFDADFCDIVTALIGS